MINVLIVILCMMGGSGHAQQQSKLDKISEIETRRARYKVRAAQRSQMTPAQRTELDAERDAIQRELIEETKRIREEAAQKEEQEEQEPLDQQQTVPEHVEQKSEVPTQQAQQTEQPAPLSEELRIFQERFLQQAARTAAELEVLLYNRKGQDNKPMLSYNAVRPGLDRFLRTWSVAFFVHGRNVSNSEREAKLLFLGRWLRGFISPHIVHRAEYEEWTRIAGTLNHMQDQALSGATADVQAVVRALGEILGGAENQHARQLFTAVVDVHRGWWQKSARYLVKRRGTVLLTTTFVSLLCYYLWKYRDEYY